MYSDGTVALSPVHPYISSMQNYRIISSSLSHIIHAKPSHHLHFTARYHTCRTVALSPVHCHVSSVQNCRTTSISLSCIIYAELSHCHQFTTRYHTRICKTVALSPFHWHVSYTQNCHIISSSLSLIIYADCRIVSSTKSRAMYPEPSHYLRFTISPNNMQYFHHLLLSVIRFFGAIQTNIWIVKLVPCTPRSPVGSWGFSCAHF
jgi:hypothetical protein